ncbi:translesion error-prone DNA polymerase V autoproteolytic subunit [Pedobacter sp. MC2016-15]|uniref:LexA family protein n=1 Tax=Pedobacter sp. MC2016-15 TaxID=2994473 RepID=UPI002247BF8C|nr:translesion error-prone DNA polymerase V autoproteolytic subunit [Pedobacter sp. MC2016-15]MCX2480715.1 translesion error-prone DNA polymerase V autoproteolytic subunit [Pedobacter sp. MC2016-15]
MKELLLYEKGESETLIPLFLEKIHAGFESPAADYEEERIDLNTYVTKYPHATFYARVVGDCMTGSGIYPDDLLVVDRSLNPTNGDIVVGILDNEFILRSYFKTGTKEYLMPDNVAYQPIAQNPTTHFEIWGVVPHSILDQRRRINARLNRFQQFLR